MKKLSLILIALMLVNGHSGAQGPAADFDKALALIRPALIKSHVKFLSHDLLGGRGTGDVGFEIAREYVASQFVRLGLEPIDGASYLQAFDVLLGGRDQGSQLIVSNVTIGAEEGTFSPAWLESNRAIATEGVFLGYAWPSAGKDPVADVKGKVVFMLLGMPPGVTDEHEATVLARLKMERVTQRGAAALVVLVGGAGRAIGAGPADAPAMRQQQPPMSRQAMREGGGGAPLKALGDGTGPARPDVMLNPEASRRLLAAWGIDPATLSSQVAVSRSVGQVTLKRAHEIKKVKSWNVIGILRGADPKLKDECVVLTAHLDHVGMGIPDASNDSIFNGAHDNAMGVGKMLATAEALSMVRPRPRRSIVFAAVGAEEGGVLGSWYYVRHPVFPLNRTVANLNQDGGREGAASEDVITFGNQFSNMLDEVLKQSTSETGMRVSTDRRPPLSPSALFSSDHYPFMIAGVPALYMMDGFTVAGDPDRGWKDWTSYSANRRHKQSDNFEEQWTFESPARMATLMSRIAWKLAAADSAPQWNTNAPLKRTP